MNRFKKYVRETCNIRLANEYPCLPFKVESLTPVFLEDVLVDATTATITHIYNVDVVKFQLGRDGIWREIQMEVF